MIVSDVRLLEEDVLGPGKRVGVWFHGCNLNCKDCIVPELWKNQGKHYSPAELFSLVSSFGVKEISISGGEPFQQDKDELKEFLKLLKRDNFGVWVYTGYTLEELVDMDFVDLLDYIDVLVDGRYDDALNDGKPWRGSANQRIILLSKRYSWVKVPDKRKIQLEITEKGIILIGIPPKGFLRALENNLSQKDVAVKF